MPAYEERVVRPSAPVEDKKPEPLDEDQREALVALIQQETPIRRAVEDAAKEWPEKDLEKALNMASFRALWREECLGEGDDQLRWKAEAVAGAKKVEEVLNPEAGGFGEL